MPDAMVSGLNTYLDELMEQEDRTSHAGTLVGQIGHWQQLTMDHNDPRLNDFCQMSGILATEYLKNFGNNGNNIGERQVGNEGQWSVHNTERDYNQIPNTGTKTNTGLSCTW